MSPEEHATIKEQRAKERKDEYAAAAGDRRQQKSRFFLHREKQKRLINSPLTREVAERLQRIKDMKGSESASETTTAAVSDEERKLETPTTNSVVVTAPVGMGGFLALTSVLIVAGLVVTRQYHRGRRKRLTTLTGRR
mmetsp:Transcript_5004/g.13995  ORF Transcript_5004/g.13995 Transcript_5004/m.13995 type:complete len:138 (-) Transcript_5004:71-484(-)